MKETLVPGVTGEARHRVVTEDLVSFQSTTSWSGGTGTVSPLPPIVVGTITVIPEPGMLVLLVTAVATTYALILIRRRRV